MNKESDKEKELLDVVDIEEVAKHDGGKPPKAKRYRIRIDKEKYVVDRPAMTGRQILELAGKQPAERWMLNQKMKGGQIRAVGLDDDVDFTEPGVERFMTLPKDQTEGRSAARRQFSLPEDDSAALDADGHQWESIRDGGTLWLLVHDFPLPGGFTVAEASAAVGIPSGYPSAQLDMVFFHPAIQRIDGKKIPATDATQTIDGRLWQRWSRHYTSANPWKVGEYNVATHLQLARHWLERAAV